MAEMKFFKKRSNPLFDVAMAKTKSLRDALVDDSFTELKQNKFFRIVEGDQNSPLIMGMGNHRHMIYYPKNSTPYLHQYETSIKQVEIVSGEIFDEITGNSFKSGDKLTIYPDHKIKPYTKNQECYLVVTVTQIDSIWSQKCEE